MLHGEISKCFISLRGVRQGENMSPLLFSLFVNDLEESLLQNGCNFLEYGDQEFETLFKVLICG